MSELAFVTRTLAGAASRAGTVQVMTPAPAGTTVADGCFDLTGIGTSDGEAWPDPAAVQWPPLGRRPTWIVDEVDPRARALVATLGNGQRVLSVAPVPDDAHPGIVQLALVSSSRDEGLGVHVPINPLAGSHRHMGLGFTGYLLVLSDRTAWPSNDPPTDAVGWLTSRFYDSYVVVVEDGVAAAWKGRALRGVVPVDTRTDLWRLLAHAQLTVDLAPGDVVARECIESLRFGTPIVVPEGSIGATHAHAGGGVPFSDIRGLFEGVERLLDESTRETFSRGGSRYAHALFGDPVGFVSRLAGVLWPDA